MVKRPDPILKEGKDTLEEAWTYDKENRDEAIKDLRFKGLDQWPESVRTQREQEGRPCLTLDHLSQYINQVVNDIRQAKIGIRAVGVDSNADPKIAELVTDLMRDIQYQSNAIKVYADAAQGQVSCGIGHFRFLTDYAKDSVSEQEIQIRLIPYPLAVYWDPSAILPDRSDAQYCHVVDFLPTRVFERKYPKAKKVEIDAPKDWNGMTGFYWGTHEGVLISEYWRKVPSKKTLMAFEDGSTYDVTDLDEEEIAQLGQPVATREADSYKVEQYILSGAEVLEGPNEWTGCYIPIVPVVGDETYLDTKCIRRGLIRGARDGQQLYNYWRSAAAELIALAPKSKWVVTAKQIAEYKEQWDRSNVSPTPYLMFKPDPDVATGAPTRIAPPEPPVAIWKEAELVIGDLKAATGIYDASLGAKGNETSGVAIARRQSEGDVANYHYADNLHRSLEHAGRIMLELIPKIYDTQRMVRLTAGDDSTTYEMINHTVMDVDGTPVILNNLSTGKFDIRVDVGPSYSTQRLEAVTSMIEYYKLDPSAAPISRDLFVKNMDWPGADELATRMKKTIPPQLLDPKEIDPNTPPPQPQIPPEIQMKQQELQMKQQEMQAKMQLEQQKMQMEAQKAQQELAIEQRRLEMEAQKLELEKAQASDKMQMEMFDKQKRLEMDKEERAIRLVGEQEKQQGEMKKHDDSMQLEREKHASSTQVEREKHASSQQLEREKHESDKEFEREKVGIPKKVEEANKKHADETKKSNENTAKMLEQMGKQIVDAVASLKQDTDNKGDKELTKALAAISKGLDKVADVAEAAKVAAERASKPKKISFRRGRDGSIEGADSE